MKHGSSCSQFRMPHHQIFLAVGSTTWTAREPSDAGRFNKGENVHQHVGLPPRPTDERTTVFRVTS
jgi:hypothetical protein